MKLLRSVVLVEVKGSRARRHALVEDLRLAGNVAEVIAAGPLRFLAEVRIDDVDQTTAVIAQHALGRFRWIEVKRDDADFLHWDHPDWYVHPGARSLSIRTRLAERSVTPPRWALRLLPACDAARYRREWGAHLHQLQHEGLHRQARRDRRRLVLRAPGLAAELRVRAAIRRLQRRTR